MELLLYSHFNQEEGLTGPVCNLVDGLPAGHLATETDRAGRVRWAQQELPGQWGTVCLPLLWHLLVFGICPTHPVRDDLPMRYGQLGHIKVWPKSRQAAVVADDSPAAATADGDSVTAAADGTAG